MSDDQHDPWLYARDVAALLNIKPPTWRRYVKRGLAPQPDDPDKARGGPKQGRRPRWRTSTVTAYRDARKGPGYRTDLHRDRAEQAAERAAALAEDTTVPADLYAWLTANHGRLRAAAGVLVDHRDALVDNAGPLHRDDLADAIEAAGEAMGGAPSRTLAGAVAMALLHARPGGDPELHDALAPHARLRAEYEAVRPPAPGRGDT